MESTPDGQGFSRVYWMFLGPAILFLLVMGIGLNKSEGFTKLDFAYFLLSMSVMLTRWLEFRRGNSLNSTGEPATIGDLRSYLIWTPLTVIGVWLLAKAIGNLL